MIMIMLCLDNPPTRINFLFFLSLSEHVSWHVVGWARKEETSKLFSFLLPCLIQILRWNHFLKPTKAIAVKVLSPIVIRSEISGHSNANAAPDAKFICGKIKQRSFGNNRPNGNCWNWLLSPPWGQLDPVVYFDNRQLQGPSRVQKIQNIVTTTSRFSSRRQENTPISVEYSIPFIPPYLTK